MENTIKLWSKYR